MQWTAFTGHWTPASAQGGQAHGVCYPAAFMGGQSAKARSIAYCDDGSTPTLKSAPSGDNTVPDVVYAVEGNTVDRESKKNGRGYCEDVSPTLNTQDKHAVTYAIEGNGQRESHQGDGYSETDKMYTLNTIERHAVAFQSSGDRSNPSGDSTKANLVVTTIDCRNMQANQQLSGTIQAKNQGGYSLNYINPIVYDARGNGGGMITPTITGDHNGHISDYTCVCVERANDE